MRLIEFADHYCTLVGGGAGYREQLRVLVKRLPWGPADLTAENITEYLQSALATLQPSTVANHRRMLITLHRHAAANGLVEECTDKIGRVKTRPKIIRCWTHVQIQRLLGEARKLQGRTRKCPCDYAVVMPAYILTAYSSGLRRGDLLSIEWGDLEGDRLVVSQHKTAHIHVAVLDQQCMDALAVLPRFGKRVFGDILTKDRVKLLMRRCVDRAGLQGSGKWLRRSSATYAELSGISATLQLGHKTPGLAWSNYIDRVLLSEMRRPVPSLPEAS